MARYLVTGGAGFIGSHVVDALAGRGDTIRVVDDLSTGRRENLAAHPRVELIEADLAEPQVAERAVAGVDRALHLAAIPSVPRSVRAPRRSHRANVEATHGLLLAARDAGVRRVVLASSSSVYGESETLPKHEGLRPAPLSPYALHKLIGEQYAALFSRLYGLETVALRFFNVFGPRQSPQSQYSGVISLFIAALLEGRPATIYGDGEQTRDFTYVADVVRGVLLASEAPGASGRAVNLARGGRMSVNELYAGLQRATGASVAAHYAEARRGDVRHSQAGIELARDLLGFEPRVSVEEGLRRTVDWQRAQVEEVGPAPVADADA
jgi:UDP-glucose 4-epimerase